MRVATILSLALSTPVLCHQPTPTVFPIIKPTVLLPHQHIQSPPVQPVNILPEANHYPHLFTPPAYTKEQQHAQIKRDPPLDILDRLFLEESTRQFQNPKPIKEHSHPSHYPQQITPCTPALSPVQFEPTHQDPYTPHPKSHRPPV